MMLKTALYQLRNMPQSFLGTHLVVTAGAPQSGQRLYYFGYTDLGFNPTVTGNGFKFSTSAATLDTRQSGYDSQSYTALQVHNVRMIPATEDIDVSAIEPYVLDGTGPDIMVTGQLSGCVFCVRQEPGRLIVAHIQPGGRRQGGAMLRNTLKLMGRFQGYGRITHVFGVGDYTARAHVLGVRTGGVWRIFGQKVNSGTGPITGTATVV